MLDEDAEFEIFELNDDFRDNNSIIYLPSEDDNSDADAEVDKSDSEVKEFLLKNFFFRKDAA